MLLGLKALILKGSYNSINSPLSIYNLNKYPVKIETNHKDKEYE